MAPYVDDDHHKPTTDLLLTAQEVADILQVGQRTVLRWARRGVLEAVRLTPQTIRFRRSAVDAILARVSR
jgi:excisionase family DNA binding protein